LPFPGLWIVRKQRFSISKFTICLQFCSTKWAKAYLINYILEKTEKLQESMGNMILCILPLKLWLINCQYFKGILFKW
jgi:hypothetical protein